MIQRRTCRVLELLAFLFWLNLLLNFFGLLSTVITTAEAALNANLAFGSFSFTPGHILAFAVAVGGFLSRFEVSCALSWKKMSIII